jgi:hypothetical protein
MTWTLQQTTGGKEVPDILVHIWVQNIIDVQGFCKKVIFFKKNMTEFWIITLFNGLWGKKSAEKKERME